MQRIIDDLRYATSSLVRELSFTGPVLLSITLGVGVVLSILGLLRLDSLDPLRVSSTVTPEYIRDAGWGARWSGPMWSSAQIQAAHFESLLDVLVVVAALGFAIACFTVVILVLVRASTRTHEMGLRVAVGAPRRRLLLGLLAEGVLLASVGGLLGSVLGFIGVNIARASWPHGVNTSSLGIDPWIVILGLGAPILAVVPFSVFAAAGVLRRSDLSGALLSGADATSSQGELVLQDFLAVVQLAASITLVVGAGLLIQNASGALDTTPAGYDPRGVVTLELDLPEPGYSEASKRVASYEALLDGVATLANVKAESLSTPGAWLGVGPVALATAQCGRCYRGGMYVPIIPAYVRLHAVSPGFFRALGVGLFEGREFSSADRVDAPRVMVVNRTFAESHFEEGQPLERKVRIGGIQDPWYTVVGVVDDIRARGIGSSSRAVPVAYVPILQDPPLAVDLAVRGSSDREVLASAVRQAIAGTGMTGVVVRESTMEAYLKHHVAPIQWLGLVLGLVGALGLVVAMHGSYSVMRFKVSRRRREIGILRALGARRWGIVRMIVLQSLGLTCIGAALGSWGALLLAGWLDIIVPGLRAFDMGIYGSAVLLLSAAALFGGSLPARQATRVHPAVAIRTE